MVKRKITVPRSPAQEKALLAGRLRNVYALASHPHITVWESWFLRWIADRALSRMGHETETERQIRFERAAWQGEANPYV